MKLELECCVVKAQAVSLFGWEEVRYHHWLADVDYFCYE